MSKEKKPKKKTEAKRLGEYILTRLIGKGGMGVVYKAEKPGSKKHFALKVLLPALSSDKASLERFKREIEAGQKLDHPGIVKVHGVGVDGDKYFFAMDYIDGQALDKIIDGEGIAPEEAARVIRDSADALQHAHDMGIVHRDVKPNNIILSGDRRVYITDFGIAREESAARLTAEGQIMGTPFYMSPEQAMGRRKEISPASDIYSLGITFYELLTRTTPFRGLKIHQIVRKILTEDPIPPSQVAGGVPRDLEMVVMKAIRKEPQKRYGSAREFAEDIDRFLEGKPVLARPMGKAEQLLRSVKLNKGLWATGAVAAIVVVAFVVFLAAHSSAARARFLQEEKEKRENISALLGAAKEDFKARDYGKAREALEEVLALDKENGKAIRFLAAVEDARKAAEKRRSWAERKKKATDLARKGDEARSRFQGVHIRRMAFLKRLMDSWDEHGPGYESGQVNRTVNELRACASEARALEDRALELFDQALLLDAENTDAHRGIASVRMDACEAAFQTALRSGDFAEVERLLFLAEQHDRARDQAERIREIRKWIHWEQAVEIRPSPRGDIVEIYRVDLEIGVETSLGTSNSGDFRLKPGSYVAVIAKRGYVRTRLPFVVECPKADGGAAEVLHLGVRLVLDEEKFKGMAYVPDGIFLMGGGGGKRGGEQRRVRLPAYFIDMKEVTGAAFEVFLDRLARENPSLLAKYRPRYNITILPEHMTMRKDAWGKTRPDPFRPEDYSMAWILHEDGTWSPQKDWKGKPVGGICYEAARAFASSLGKRLPTSQEWEKAARGVDGRRYPWGNRFDEKRASNVRHPEYDPLYGWRMIRPGSAMKDGASPYGVLHMAGNLAEWTSTNSRGENKINRGGCAFDEIPMLRCASRDDTFPGDYNSALGFRCVRDAE